MGARVINLVLAVWLVVSSLLFRLPQGLRRDGLVTGVLCVAFALASIAWKPVLKYALTVLSLWLFFSAFALGGTHAAAMWNLVLVGGVMFIVSLAPVENEIPLFRLRRDGLHLHRPQGPQAV